MAGIGLRTALTKSADSCSNYAPQAVIHQLTQRAVNSAVECHLHTVEATGSIPVPPTKISLRALTNELSVFLPMQE